MKIRNGFVSNSSSSSFTCCECGNTESGWDLGLQEAGMFQCEKCGRNFCEGCGDKVPREEIIKELEKQALNNKYIKSHIENVDLKEADYDMLLDIANDCYEIRYLYPKEYCPNCQEEKNKKEEIEQFSKDAEWETYLRLKDKFNNR